MSRITHLLNRTGAITRKARTADGQGGWTESFSAVETAAVRLRPASAREREYGPKDVAEITHVLYAEGDANIRRSDLVEIDSESYEVVSVRKTSLPTHHLEVDLHLIQQGG
jgi:head-tail adaptor